MNATWTTGRNLDRGKDWVAAVISELVVTGGLPDLRSLAELLARACCQSAADRAVAVALPHPGAALLEAGGEGLSGSCVFVADRAGEPTWRPQPAGWNLSGKAAGITGSTGPGAWPDDLVPPPTAIGWGWQELVICLSDQPVLAVRVTHPATAGTARETENDLRLLRDALQPLLEVWATAGRLESQLRQARTANQALARLSALQEKAVAVASHEFKTPLTAITAYADALRGQITDAEFPHATEFLDVIRTEAGRLLRMANRVLDFSRLGAGLELLEVHDVALEPLADETVLALRPALAAKGLRLETRYAPGLPRVRVDADMVRQVLVNLLGNAVKYTPDGGVITLTLQEAEASVQVKVADTGVGIPQEDLQRIFREFYRTKGEASREEGTGLGLTIVRHILNLHGGHINVNRLPAGGTEFSFFLPKEVATPVPLPLDFTTRTDRDKAWRLITLLGYLAAELTGSRSMVLMLREKRGGMPPVAVMGPSTDEPGHDHWLTTELGRGKESLGVLKVGHPLSGREYSPAIAAQLGLIGDLAFLALRYLTSDGPAADDSSSGVQVAKVTEAVRSILQIRRSGVPTSSAEALDLLDKLGRRLGVGSENIRRLQYAALLHDAGMARVEVEIVMGESELSWDQRDEVDRHVEQGLDLMAPLLRDEDIVTVIRHHHERVDGKGYPAGLSGEEIPLGSRLLAVIDAWFALTRERTFRPGLPAEAAMSELRNHGGTQFDQDVLQNFEAVLRGEGILADPTSTNRN